MTKNKIITNKNIKLKKEKLSKEPHVSSKIHPDTLFTFTNKLDYLIAYLKKKRIPARYCGENMSYFKVKELEMLTFPMKCFCDINLNKLDIHMSWYGYYGIAFSKEWGMNQDIQPVHYINNNNNCSLFKDLKTIWNNILKNKT